MSDRTDALLAELIELQRRMLALQEASLANQREVMERQRRVLRGSAPVFALLVLAAVGPYIWNLVAYLVNAGS